MGRKTSLTPPISVKFALRKHGFLYDGGKGWRLAPAYDLNPVPADVKPRLLSTSITLDSSAATLELAFEVATEFGLTPDAARQIAREVAAATIKWRQTATRYGLTEQAANRMAFTEDVAIPQTGPRMVCRQIVAPHHEFSYHNFMDTLARYFVRDTLGPAPGY